MESAGRGFLFPTEYEEGLTDRVTLFRTLKRSLVTDIGLRN